MFLDVHFTFNQFPSPSQLQLPEETLATRREKEHQKLPPSLRLPSFCMLHLPSLVSTSKGKLLLLSKPPHFRLFSSSLFFSLFPSNQPRPDWTLHVTNLVLHSRTTPFLPLSLKAHSIYIDLTLPLFFSLIRQSGAPWLLYSKPQVTPLHSGLLLLISLFLSNANQTPHLLWW